MLLLLVLVLVLVACGGGGPNAPSGGGANVEERVVIEKLPDGTIKKTTIRTTKRTVPMAPPPARPADPYPADPLVRYNVERVNAYRARKGLPPLLYDRKISELALRGSQQLASDHRPHAHFAAHAKGAPGFGSRAAENQGDENGVPVLDPNPTKNGQRQIDAMLELMFAEGPGGGHYDNMMSKELRRIGVGLFNSAGRLYMTNDFSD
ncbi:MAG: CAP domain-containing protein [Labilithrix sp.]|nr:CAP domain-containing protein [Labilithrix sp.]MCW5815932.1 CAP domain-containing protein [Labilithrix sp.]